ncbi:hypothetical protein [Roseibium aggregatum]|uniref:Uncharacterized protein n=1 Tax=Roseibium aggregatum TaxID=187304 RepID=A0A0M6Y8U2_9HYPH|nr:hypothetical protein [Roseibium aggregatum]CTQ45687.1 hypothetical protein LAL4801_04142 [Roseibium aggregatum]
MFVVRNRSGYLALENGEFFFAKNPNKAFKFSTLSEADGYASEYGGSAEPSSAPRFRRKNDKRSLAFSLAA